MTMRRRERAFIFSIEGGRETERGVMPHLLRWQGLMHDD